MNISPCSFVGLNSVMTNVKKAMIDGIKVQQNSKHSIPLKFFPM